MLKTRFGNRRRPGAPAPPEDDVFDEAPRFACERRRPAISELASARYSSDAEAPSDSASSAVRRSCCPLRKVRAMASSELFPQPIPAGKHCLEQFVGDCRERTDRAGLDGRFAWSAADTAADHRLSIRRWRGKRQFAGDSQRVHFNAEFDAVTEGFPGELVFRRRDSRKMEEDLVQGHVELGKTARHRVIDSRRGLFQDPQRFRSGQLPSRPKEFEQSASVRPFEHQKRRAIDRLQSIPRSRLV